jgi:hypothetical protein
MDPQQALASTGDYAIAGSINNDQLLIQGLDVNNAILGQADYAPPATFASFGAIPTGARVVVEKNGVCTTFAIDDDGPTGPRHELSPCFEPRLATVGNEGAILYQTSPGGPLALHQIPADAAAAGTTIPLEIGSNPGGHAWRSSVMAKEKFVPHQAPRQRGDHRSHRPRQDDADRRDQRGAVQGEGREVQAHLVQGHRQGRHRARRHQDGDHRRGARRVRVPQPALRPRRLPRPRRLHQEHDHRRGADGRRHPGGELP